MEGALIFEHDNGSSILRGSLLIVRVLRLDTKVINIMEMSRRSVCVCVCVCGRVGVHAEYNSLLQIHSNNESARGGYRQTMKAQ